MRIAINPDNPQKRLLDQIAKLLQSGGVIIYPTDTLYALGCDIHNKAAVKKMGRIKGLDPEKAHLSCVCDSVGIISTYANQVSTPIYKLLKAALPGPYTFVLKASREVPRYTQSPKKTVGIRVPDHAVSLGIVQALGHPIISSSLPADADGLFAGDPEVIYERFGKLVDAMVDAGPGPVEASTVIDCSQGEDNIQVQRIGLGPLEPLGLEIQD